MITKIGIIGNGQVGLFLYQSLINEFSNDQYLITLYSRKNGFDITRPSKLKIITNDNDLIINCAAFTNVDEAELYKQACKKINYDAVRNLVDQIKNTDKKLIHFSSDYVYGNNKIKDRPLKENDICKPCNYYGKSKLMADKYILKNMTKNFLILRPSWIFGPNGNNFIDKLINKINSEHEIKVVNDQYGTITSTYLLYKIIKLYIDSSLKDGLYNICCEKIPNIDWPSRFDICSKLIDFMKLKNINLSPCKSNEFHSLAKRQTNSLLDCTKLDKEISKHSNISRTSWDIELSNYIQLYFKNLKKEL